MCSLLGSCASLSHKLVVVLRVRKTTLLSVLSVEFISEVGERGLCVCRVLCSTVKELVARLASAGRDDSDTVSISGKCSVLNEKLDALIKTLHEESQAATAQHDVGGLSRCFSAPEDIHLLYTRL